MDKKTYVTRLKKMLNRYPDSAGSHCPAAKYYGDNIRRVSVEDCDMCQEFVGLIVSHSLFYVNKCPCFRPNTETAVKRALEYIEKWEKKHGEIKS